MTAANKHTKGNFKDNYLPFLFLQLYGENGYFEPHHEVTYTEHKKHILKLLNTINIAIKQTIKIVDKSHKTALVTIISDCSVEIRKAKSFHAINCATIVFQTKLILALIGNVPYNSSKQKVSNRQLNWQLDSYRSIRYSQTREQKFRLLKSIIEEGRYKDEFKNYCEASKKYQTEHRKGEDLLSWFKRLYPENYLDIFDCT